MAMTTRDHLGNEMRFNHISCQQWQGETFDHIAIVHEEDNGDMVWWCNGTPEQIEADLNRYYRDWYEGSHSLKYILPVPVPVSVTA